MFIQFGLGMFGTSKNVLLTFWYVLPVMSNPYIACTCTWQQPPIYQTNQYSATFFECCNVSLADRCRDFKRTHSRKSQIRIGRKKNIKRMKEVVPMLLNCTSKMWIGINFNFTGKQFQSSYRTRAMDRFGAKIFVFPWQNDLWWLIYKLDENSVVERVQIYDHFGIVTF